MRTGRSYNKAWPQHGENLSCGIWPNHPFILEPKFWKSRQPQKARFSWGHTIHNKTFELHVAVSRFLVFGIWTCLLWWFSGAIRLEEKPIIILYYTSVLMMPRLSDWEAVFRWLLVGALQKYNFIYWKQTADKMVWNNRYPQKSWKL